MEKHTVKQPVPFPERVDICLKEISDHVGNMDKEKHFKIWISTKKKFHP